MADINKADFGLPETPVCTKGERGLPEYQVTKLIFARQ